uniref:Type I restriction enzyme M protein n=1 Tax=Candidatus Kentrum sp. FM TaxID=2126340 RepID=A0A450VNH1_9GAMM|nr:MAG: type I restriction enzyme M protein [Candidatus Kentron sp. FM]VFJ44396.1 MAG: type I restriction enzyme M protein [Candidatus Kentron sp. FM]VFK06270.1 MAG: type I restriction enzyme M protein [Candidatus Kentron sp. FM]
MVNKQDFAKFWPEGIPLRKSLAEFLNGEFQRPEGRVRCEWIRRLVLEYGYPTDQIDIEVPAGAGREAERSIVTADIVAYRDTKRKEPFIVVETKRPEEKKGILQAESYARNLGAEFHVWSNLATTKYYRTAKFRDQSTELGNIPSWVGAKPVRKRLGKNILLPPFKDETHLRAIVKNCHNRIFFRLGHDPAKAFDELMKLLFLKMYDERETPRYYEFACLDGETAHDTGERIRTLFARSVESRRYKDVFTTQFSGGQTDLQLDDETIRYIVSQFQGYSVITTSATLEGADVKGTVFEQMVGRTFRGELGAYFTPRELVEFMVSMLDPGIDDVILDPSCGSGGFLIMAIKYVLEKQRANLPNLTDADIYAQLRQFAENNMFGVDLNDRMARVSKMNMIMHGDGHSGIFHENGLNIGYARHIPIQFSDVSMIFSNPPFSGREGDPQVLRRFDCSIAESGTRVSVHKSLPFVEMIINLLAEGGTTGLVLPGGIFSSQSYQFEKLREIIWEKTEILAVIGLPHWVFFHTGCDVQGALLFIRRTSNPRKDYSVFIDWAEHVGYDASGRKTDKNDLPQILQRFRKQKRENLFKASFLRQKGRIDPLYYQPGEAAQRLRVAKDSGQAVSLTELTEAISETISRSNKNKSVVRYIEVNDTDKQTGEILRFREYEVRKLPSRAKFIIRENNILIPNHRNSIKAKRSVVLVPPEYDGAVCTSRFIVLRPRIPALYLYYILNLEFIKEAMLRLVTGSSSTEVKFAQLSDIYVPMPEGEDFDLFIDDVVRLREETDHLEMAINEKKKALESLFLGLYKQ